MFLDDGTIIILIITTACREEIEETTGKLYTEVWVGEAGGDIFAFASMVTIPSLIIFLLFQKWFLRSVASSGIKG